jgi:hypothetical protein
MAGGGLARRWASLPAAMPTDSGSAGNFSCLALREIHPLLGLRRGLISMRSVERFWLTGCGGWFQVEVAWR